MVNISNCPDTGLERKITAKDLYKLESVKQVILRCHISHYKDGQKVENTRIKSYTRDLVASDSYCNPQTGEVWPVEKSEAYKQKLRDIADYELALEAYTSAHDTWLNTPEAERGDEPQAPVQPEPPTEVPITEYEFFQALTSKPVVMDALERQYIQIRDLQGKFNN